MPLSRRHLIAGLALLALPASARAQTPVPADPYVDARFVAIRKFALQAENADAPLDISSTDNASLHFPEMQTGAVLYESEAAAKAAFDAFSDQVLAFPDTDSRHVGKVTPVEDVPAHGDQLAVWDLAFALDDPELAEDSWTVLLIRVGVIVGQWFCMSTKGPTRAIMFDTLNVPMEMDLDTTPESAEALLDLLPTEDGIMGVEHANMVDEDFQAIT